MDTSFRENGVFDYASDCFMVNKVKTTPCLGEKKLNAQTIKDVASTNKISKIKLIWKKCTKCYGKTKETKEI